MEFWNSLLTEKSWEILKKLRKDYNFILIGGWAIYLLTKQQKSKDIDIIASLNELEKLKKENLGKNTILKKYEIKKDDVDIDIYVEYYSKFAIPVEEIKNYTINVEGFKIASPEILLILKQSAYQDRENSVKGEKDLIDIISLLVFWEINFDKYRGLLKKYKLSYSSNLRKLLINFKDYNSLNLTPREFKIRKNKILEKLK